MEQKRRASSCGWKFRGQGTGNRGLGTCLETGASDRRLRVGGRHDGDRREEEANDVGF